MNRFWLAILVLIFGSTVLTGQARDYLPDQIVLRLTQSSREQLVIGSQAGVIRTGIGSVDQLNQRYQVVKMAPLLVFPARNQTLAEEVGLTRIYILTAATSVDIPAMAAAYHSLGEVEFAEPNFIAHANGVSAPALLPNDPLYNNQWAHENTGQVIPAGGGGPVGTPGVDMSTDQAWDLHTGDPSVILSILDTGVDYLHPEFSGRIVPGHDFINNDSDPMDDNGHGTACAGIAAATGNNGIGVAGVNWGCRILPVKVLDAGGSGSYTAIANGITFAADSGARVLSMSLGGGSPSATLEAALNYAFGLDCILLAARGNDNVSTPSYPASYANVVAVGALSPCDERKNPASCDGETWWGSSFGADLDFMAPGVRIQTTDIQGAGGYDPGEYTATFNGTSAATPFAAGVAALVRSYLPGLTNAQVRDRMRATSVDMLAAGFDDQSGFGRVNAYYALLGYLPNSPDIAVVPDTIRATIPIGGNTSEILTINNVAAPPADDLIWTAAANNTVVAALPTRRNDKFRSAPRTLNRPGPRPGGTLPEGLDYSAAAARCYECASQVQRKIPTVLPPDNPQAGIVADPSFEAGPGAGFWSEFSSNFGTPLCSQATCGGPAPNTGVYHAWFGGISAYEEGWVNQVVVIPSGTATLSFYLMVGACDSPADYLEVAIDGALIYRVDGSSGLCGTNTWGLETVDISAFADGNSHVLEFRSEIFAANGSFSNFFIDDVDITVAVPPCPWISLGLTSGTTVAGGSDQIPVNIDAAGLAVGSYQCEIEISSNDPDEATVIVPVLLEVVPLTFQQQVLSGWNMISLPWQVADPNYLAVYPNANPNSLFSFNGAYQPESSLINCTGYWLNFPASEVVSISGTVYDPCLITMQQGWNMIGGPSCDVPLAAVDDPGGILVANTLFGFSGVYTLEDTIRQGQAYWLMASSPGVIALSCAPVLGKTAPLAASLPDDLSAASRITIADAAGKQVELLWGAPLPEPDLRQQYRLPPVPPAGAFDARFPGDFRLIETDQAVIRLQGDDYPLRFRASTIPVAGKSYQLQQWAAGSLIATAEILPDQPVSISNPLVSELRIVSEGSTAPVRFEISQNYPNPFNPTTEIRFALPQREKVVVRIYNALGQRIITLLSAEREAGWHSLTWDGRNEAGQPVSSGIYFYTVNAGPYRGLKKMMLLK